jgi:hypothetical protein
VQQEEEEDGEVVDGNLLKYSRINKKQKKPLGRWKVIMSNEETSRRTSCGEKQRHHAK